MSTTPPLAHGWNDAQATFESSDKIDTKSKPDTSDPFVFRLYGDPILTLRANGIVEIAKCYTPSEAGAAFLDYVREHWPKEESCRRIRELEERVKRLEEAGDILSFYIENAPYAIADYRAQAGERKLRIDNWNAAKEAKL